MSDHSDRQRWEAVFLHWLPWIERTIAGACGRQRMHDADREDFQSWVICRLIEHDYALLRKFRGESAITTFLVVVIRRLLQDYRVRQWGRWRPSAAARRAGKTAVSLEMLLYRDGYTFPQAVEVLGTREGNPCSARVLARLFHTLPPRSSGRPGHSGEPGDAADRDLADQTRADHRTLVGERDRAWHLAAQALDAALAKLTDEDRRLVRLRFCEQQSVADIARATRAPQAALYKRLARVLRTLRRRLEAMGITGDDVREVIEPPAA